MAKDAKGRRGGTHAKTARHESVGPHHVTRDQENPAEQFNAQVLLFGGQMRRF
jgi:hypothetical protein